VTGIQLEHVLDLAVGRFGPNL